MLTLDSGGLTRNARAGWRRRPTCSTRPRWPRFVEGYETPAGRRAGPAPTAAVRRAGAARPARARAAGELPTRPSVDFACERLETAYRRAMLAAKAGPRPRSTTASGGSATAQLDARAERRPSRLRASGVRTDAIVGILFGRTVGAVVPAMLAVFKAGAAYLPLDPAHPPARLAEILADANAAAVLTCVGARGPAAGQRAAVARRRGRCGRRRRRGTMPPSARASSMRRFRRARRPTCCSPRARPAGPRACPAPTRRWANLSPQLPPPRPAPAGQRRLVLVEPDLRRQHRRAVPAAVGRRHGPPGPRGGPARPARLRRLAERARDRERLRRAVHARDAGRRARARGRAARVQAAQAGGGANDGSVLRRIKAALPQVRIINCYGPTEATVCVTMYDVPAGVGSGTVSVGPAMDNLRVHVLDEALAPVPLGAAGEVYLAGVGGRLPGRPAATASAFVSDPFESDGGRLYPTGTSAAARRRHALALGPGRPPAQAQRGADRAGRKHRVRAGRPARGERGLRDRRPRRPAGRPDPWPTLRPAARRSRSGPCWLELAARLPSAYVPARIVVLERFPRLPNLKLDAARGPPPEPVRPAPAAGPAAAPLGPTERALAEVWSSVVGAPPEDAEANFFVAGGTLAGRSATGGLGRSRRWEPTWACGRCTRPPPWAPWRPGSTPCARRARRPPRRPRSSRGGAARERGRKRTGRRSRRPRSGCGSSSGCGRGARPTPCRSPTG